MAAAAASTGEILESSSLTTETEIVTNSSDEQLPYRTHTGVELDLMLKGSKPFAKFSGSFKNTWVDDQIAPFAPFVASGQFVSRVVLRPFPDEPSDGIREVYFALPSEEWRIDAYLLLTEIALKCGWSEALERYEGSLLGYEDWQNDWWIKNIRYHKIGIGMASVYIPVSANDLA